MLFVVQVFTFPDKSRLLTHWLTLGRVVKHVAGCLLGVMVVVGSASADSKYLPLTKDGVHDPESPAVKILQEPNEALARFPFDSVGNQVHWVKALEQGFIAPRANLLPDTKVEVLHLDVIMPRTGEMPMVLFPHRQHTEWLNCNNCHEKPFISKAGANKALNMFQVLQGEYCGLCHGAVAFPLTECRRCHSVVRK